MKYKSSRFCRNCHFPLPYKAKFCAHCGQKATDGRVPVQDLLQQLWFRVMHLESRSVRFLWRLFIPGQVSLDYFAGKRKRYPPPIQFFFVIMFFFLFTVNHLLGPDRMHVSNTKDSGIQLRGSDQNPPENLDLYEMGRKRTEVIHFWQAYDSLPELYRNALSRQALDTLLRQHYGKTAADLATEMHVENGDTTLSVRLDSITINLALRRMRIATKDIFELEPDEIIRKYQVNDGLNKLMVRQGIKTMKEPKALINKYLSSLGWTLLTLVALMATVLTLLYWSQRRYYVEHFIFLLHQNSSMFLLLTVAMWFDFLWTLPTSVWIGLVCWLAISQYWSMYRYYGQGWKMALLKWLLFSLLYLIGFAVLFVAGLLVAFALF